MAGPASQRRHFHKHLAHCSSPLQATCAEVGFCARLRAAPPSDAFYVDPGSVQLDGPALTARLRSRQDAGVALRLTLTALTATLRLHIDEEASPVGRRYQVPDVLLPGLQAAQQVAGRSHAHVYTCCFGCCCLDYLMCGLCSHGLTLS